MVSRLRSTFVMGILFALVLSLASVGVVAQPAQAASDNGTVTITSASPTMNRPNAGSCSPGGTTAHYAVLKYTSISIDSLDMGIKVTTSGPVTAILYQGAFFPDVPLANCYGFAWDQPAGTEIDTHRGYAHPEVADPNQTWYLVLASDNPGAGVTASVAVSTNTGTVDIEVPLALDTASLPSGSAGSPYSATLAASGGTEPYTFSATGLPAGLSLSAAGTISGTTTASGIFTVALTVADAQSRTISKNLQLTMAAPTITLAPATLPNPTVGAAYSQTISASGGTGPRTFAITAGSLPAGLSLNTATGLVSGTPTAGGSFGFTVTATDANSFTGSGHYSLFVAPPVWSVTPAAWPLLRVLEPVSVTIAVGGGTAPYTFSTLPGDLPPGLTLSSSGEVSGTPITAGTFQLKYSVTDSSTGEGPYAARVAQTVNVAPALLPTITPAALPGGIAGTAYTQQLAGENGVSPYSFSLTSGALPAGITLSSEGLVAGTPTASGTFPVVVTVTDSVGRERPVPFTLTIALGTVVVGPGTLPAATAHDPYSATVTASGGVGGYTYAVTAGTLPAGITLAAGGTLAGTTTASGTFNFTVTATDSSTGTGPATAAKAYALTVNAPTLPSITPAAVPAGTAGVAYSQQLSGATGVAPYAFTLSGSLPSGMTLSPAGLLSGTPSQAGTFALNVSVTDGRGLSSSTAYNLDISAPAIAVAPATLPAAQVGVDLDHQLTASGGTAPYSFAVTAGSLPTGLALTSAGTIAGTPTAPGNNNFTITATDSLGFTGSRAYPLFVAPAPLNLSPATLPAPAAGVPYSVQLSTSGGYGDFSYAVTSGALPTGLALNTDSGLISGTPTAVGSYSFAVTSTDDATSGAGTVSTARSYTVVVPSVPLNLVGTLPQAHVGDAYTAAFAAEGGTGPYLFALQPGATLPGGLAMDTNGLLTGTPTVAGTFDVEVTLTDIYGSTSNATAALTVAPLVAVGPGTLDGGQVGTAYSQQFSATGGTGPYTFAVTAGELPEGLSLSAAGLLSGTPATHGSSSFTVTARDAGNFPGSASYTVNMVPADVVLGPDALPVPTAGTPYTAQLSAAGGIGPFSFEVTAGSLPTGLSLAQATGLISGTPTAVGSFAFTITTTDAGAAAPFAAGRALAAAADGASVSRSYTVEVASAALTLSGTVPAGQVGVAYSAQLSASGGTGPYTFAPGSGAALPAGLAMDAGGKISGVPQTAGDTDVLVAFTDAQGSTGAATVALSIAPAAVVPTPSAKPSASVAATPSATPATKAGLARTGANGSTWLLAGGSIAVLGGLGALLVLRRRSSH